MKMVKKSIIALAVVALMVTVVQADTNPIKKDGDWPYTYKAIDLCTMPVYMNVGHYVQLKECNKREIKLVQVACSDIGKGGGDFPCYTDCEEITVRANFPAIFGASLSKIGGILDKTSLYWKDDINQISGSTGDWEKLTICMDAWKAQIWKAATPDTKLKVGELTINVKPPDGP
jgi:hypothetical protein